MNRADSWGERLKRASAFTPACMELCRKAAREAADERAEEIAQAILGYKLMGCLTCPHQAASADAARIARSTITKPKTREQVLEEALRSIANGYNGYADDKSECEDVARRALEWKP